MAAHADAGLSESERSCLGRYLELLEARLGGRLVVVRMFGSAARGDMWPPSSPMHSDIDLLVVTEDELAGQERDELVNDTYPLYLECGRLLSPQFLSRGRLHTAGDERRAVLLERVAAEGLTLWPRHHGAWPPPAPAASLRALPS